MVPTTRPRHQVTETPMVARAIDVAARRWPGEPRAKLLRRLIDVGGSTLERGQGAATRERLAAVDASSGKYPDEFGAEYLSDLRRDWPG